MKIIGKVEILDSTIYMIEDTLTGDLYPFNSLDEAVSYCQDNAYDYEVSNV
jgi:hypothetical protein